jgi:Domain of unknown function (DUF4372)
MNAGKTLFAQVIEFVPWKTFGRIVQKHKGDCGVRTLGCADLFRILAFSQLTWRESLRDIEACLAANQTKLFHMGLAQATARSTLADALNTRDCRIYEAFAQRLISRARALYAEDSVLGIDATIYALDASTVDLCLSLFEWTPFRANRAAIKLHTLLDLRGAIPAFVYISRGKLNEVTLLVQHPNPCRLGDLNRFPYGKSANTIPLPGFYDLDEIAELHYKLSSHPMTAASLSGEELVFCGSWQ